MKEQKKISSFFKEVGLFTCYCSLKQHGMHLDSGKGGGDISRKRHGALSLGLKGCVGLLLGVVRLLLDLSLRLQFLHQGAIVPAELLGEVLEHGEVSVRLHAHHLERLGDDHSLHLVERLGDALVALPEITQKENEEK